MEPRIASYRAKCVVLSKNRYQTRQAALALLKMAKTTSDPKVAAELIDVAANLKDQSGELPPGEEIRPPQFGGLLRFCECRIHVANLVIEFVHFRELKRTEVW